LNIENLQPQTTRRVGNPFQLTEEIRDQVISAHTPPPVGLSLFLLNHGEPIVLSKEPELVLGRGDGPSSEAMVDLTIYDGFAAGVSRRHAVIKVVEDKYILIDLNSSNGTWLNGERLLPTKAHELPSGGVIQLGRLKLVVIYNRPPASNKK
jgi:pSer/pThr/pTyr-binding forkhead associated (FHA) protein